MATTNDNPGYGQQRQGSPNEEQIGQRNEASESNEKLTSPHDTAEDDFLANDNRETQSATRWSEELTTEEGVASADDDFLANDTLSASSADDGEDEDEEDDDENDDDEDDDDDLDETDEDDLGPSPAADELRTLPDTKGDFDIEANHPRHNL